MPNHSCDPKMRLNRDWANRCAPGYSKQTVDGPSTCEIVSRPVHRSFRRGDTECRSTLVTGSAALAGGAPSLQVPSLPVRACPLLAWRAEAVPPKTRPRQGPHKSGRRWVTFRIELNTKTEFSISKRRHWAPIRHQLQPFPDGPGAKLLFRTGIQLALRMGNRFNSTAIPRGKR